MEINVAGAGAGKTTGLAMEIVEKHKTIPADKNIYCIAFTNNASESVRGKLLSYYDVIPQNIIICTIHSFLYHEIIMPYYFLIYGKHYKGISKIKLPGKQSFKNHKLKELDSRDIIHVTKIPEKAKWVIVKKSSDKLHEKTIRNFIMEAFLSYCGTIYVDEAQDIDSDMKEIFCAFDRLGIELILKGDPKQDIRGYGCFRELITMFNEKVSYNKACHRCPESHLKITNALISKEEHQISSKSIGNVKIIFENAMCLTAFDFNKYDLKYIYQKNKRFETESSKDYADFFDDLQYEIYDILSLKSDNDIKVKIDSYRITHIMICYIRSGKSVFNILKCFEKYVGGLTKSQYTQVKEVLLKYQMSPKNIITVNSVESIKGLEGNNCLFILTTDLAAYLFGDKVAENKIKNALYVALTRSLENLTILICKEVEEKYGRENINVFFEQYV